MRQSLKDWLDVWSGGPFGGDGHRGKYREDKGKIAHPPAQVLEAVT